MHPAQDLVILTDVIPAPPMEAVEGFPQASQSANGGSLFVNNRPNVVKAGRLALSGVVPQIDEVLNSFTAYCSVKNATTVPRTSK